MATLQQQIAQRFLERLAESKDVDAAKIEQLKKLLADTAHAALTGWQEYAHALLMTNAAALVIDARQSARNSTMRRCRDRSVWTLYRTVGRRCERRPWRAIWT